MGSEMCIRDRLSLVGTAGLTHELPNQGTTFFQRFAAKSALFMNDPAARNAAIEAAPPRLARKLQLLLQPDELGQAATQGGEVLAATATTFAQNTVDAVHRLPVMLSEVFDGPAGTAWAVTLTVLLLAVMREGERQYGVVASADSSEGPDNITEGERVKAKELTQALLAAQARLADSSTVEQNSRVALNIARKELRDLEAPREERRKLVEERAALLRRNYEAGAKRRARALGDIVRAAEDARQRLQAIDAEALVEASTELSFLDFICADRQVMSQSERRARAVDTLKELSARERPIRRAEVSCLRLAQTTTCTLVQ